MNNDNKKFIMDIIDKIYKYDPLFKGKNYDYETLKKKMEIKLSDILFLTLDVKPPDYKLYFHKDSNDELLVMGIEVEYNMIKKFVEKKLLFISKDD